jgi:hypothetical protein
MGADATPTAKFKRAQARAIKVSLDRLHDLAQAADLRLLAHMIGAAAEAADDATRQRNPVSLRLVKTDEEN